MSIQTIARDGSMQDSTDLMATLAALGQPRVLVLGDLILDRYTFGDAERVSQEAPVILLRADHREARLGGAANVCNMLRGLEASVSCAGVTGSDTDGQAIRQLMTAAGIETSLVLNDPSRPTTVKERFIGRAQGRHPHQILRVDSEVRTPLSEYLSAHLASQIIAQLTQFDVLLISDYDKGVCTNGLLRRVIDAARQVGVPVLVDPIRLPPGQSNGYARYRGATTMTPNRLEAELATGMKIKNSADALHAAEQLRTSLDLQFGMVTLDRDGMALVDASGHGEIFPTRQRAVYDITGAGDMVLAMIGVCLAGNVPPAAAIRLGNVAGGLEVEKVGCVNVTRDELRQELRRTLAATPNSNPKLITHDELTALGLLHRGRQERVVFTNGCFDLLHVGHVTYLQQARALGDVLVVGVNSDSSVSRLKGPTRPVIKQQDRAALLAALACVDQVIVFDEDTPHEILHRLRPDVLVKGGTYTRDQVVGHEVVEAYGGQVCVTDMVDGISTTKILSSINSHALQGPHFTAAVSGAVLSSTTEPTNTSRQSA